QLRKPIVAAFGRPDFDRNVLAQNITAFTKASMECGQAARRIDNVNKPDHRHRCLLRVCPERPSGCRATEQRDELAPRHSITSSAATSSLSGTVRSRSRAAWWLRTSSNLVDWRTGRSAGLAPLRMRPT